MTFSRVLLYEFVTGGGCWSLADNASPDGTLLAEGTAMVQSIAGDLLAQGQHEVHVLADSRLARFWPDGCRAHAVRGSVEERQLLRSLAASCDVSLIIAPEFDELLFSRSRWITAAGGTLTSPDETFIALAANKPRLANHLAEAGIPLPRSIVWRSNEPVPIDFPYPAVLKPVAGAGSLDVHLIKTAWELEAFRTARSIWQLEAFQPGISSSVGLLCGPNQTLALQPGQQLLSTDGKFRFLGSAWPLTSGQQKRAVELALRVVSAMPAARGYIGIDLVLGPADDGRDDVVIEVNPRLTTSYVGLRQLAKSNLAATMLSVASGLPATVAWHTRAVTYHVGEPVIGARACNG